MKGQEAINRTKGGKEKSIATKRKSFAVVDIRILFGQGNARLKWPGPYIPGLAPSIDWVQ